jgi:hypothetical protein
LLHADTGIGKKTVANSTIAVPLTVQPRIVDRLDNISGPQCDIALGGLNLNGFGSGPVNHIDVLSPFQVQALAVP